MSTFQSLAIPGEETVMDKQDHALEKPASKQKTKNYNQPIDS